MLINHKKRALFYLEPKTASRRCRRILEDRGFGVAIGHHDGLTSRNNMTTDGPHISIWMTYGIRHIGVVVRDHFDVILSRWANKCRAEALEEGLAPPGRPGIPLVPYSFVRDCTYTNPSRSADRGKMFPLMWEAQAIANHCSSMVRIISADDPEHLRIGMDGFLDLLGLEETEDEEWVNSHATEYKPNTHGMPWNWFTPRATREVIERFWFERDMLGYPNDV
jgi:hypothetical protein